MSNETISVLVIDDDPFMREFANTVLLGAGFVVRLAESASEGQAQASTLRPDVILLDYAMPGGTGLEILASLNAVVVNSSRIVVLSAWNSDEVRKQTAAMGIGWRDKPLSAEQLVATVRSAAGHA